MLRLRRFSLVAGPRARRPVAGVVGASARAVTASVAPPDHTTVGLGNTILDPRPSRMRSSTSMAYQSHLRYDSTILTYRGPTAGDVADRNGQPILRLQPPLLDVEAPADTAGVDCAQLGRQHEWPGVLIYFNFKAGGDRDQPDRVPESGLPATRTTCRRCRLCLGGGCGCERAGGPPVVGEHRCRGAGAALKTIYR
jgi:hypothetical protein